MPKGRKLDEYGLTRQQRIFADEFIITGNKKQSAIKAGVKARSAATIGGRLFNNVDVLTYIQQRKGQVVKKIEDDYGTTINDLIRELAAIARFDPRKMYDENGVLIPIHKLDEMTARGIAGFEVREVTDSDGALIGYDKKVKIASKVAAIELLGRHLRMWADKGGDGGSILNINIITDKNQLDHPNYGKVIENGTK